jgi:serine/threonine protein kinase
MIPSDDVRAVGPYQLARVLEPSSFGDRWLAQHEERHTDWIIHRFAPSMDQGLRVLLLSWIESAASFSHAHLPSITRVSGGLSGMAPGDIWAAEPYLGNEDGLVTVDRLVELKGGRMSAPETERVLLHTLDAMQFAHGLGICHGHLAASDLLVDRHGSITLDLYGLRRRLDGILELDSEVVLDEVRSVAMIGYWALTGLEAEEPRIRASQLIRRLDRGWDEWFEVALDPVGGFSTAADALAALPSNGLRGSGPGSGSGPGPGQILEPKANPARSVFERLRTAWSSTSETDHL